MADADAPTAANRRAQRQQDKAAEPKSWGESLQRYNVGRTTPIHPSVNSPLPPSKHGEYNATIRPPVFHPIRQHFNDGNKEQLARAREEEKCTRHIEDARWRQDHIPSHLGYNILTGTLQQTTNTDVAQKLARADSAHRTRVQIDSDTGRRDVSFTFPSTHPRRRDYNILTNKFAFEGSEERLKQADYRAPPEHSRSDKERREYNIVSNKYQFESHEQRAAREHSVLAQQLRDKYFAQTHYNPIQQRFVHPVEEERYQQAKLEASASHGRAQLAQLPPNFKQSEGMLYDILAPARVKDAAQLDRVYEAPREGKRASHQLKYETDRAVQAGDIQRDDLHATRALNRIHERRFRDDHAKGYDPITNTQYEGRDARALFRPHDANRSGGWEKLQRETSTASLPGLQ